MEGKWLITGANGFVGTAVVNRLVERERPRIRAAVRRQETKMPAPIERAVVGDLSADTDWRPALESVSVVVHLAARVHIMRDTADSPLAACREVNVEGTRTLARQASAAGVRRFVFVSSIKVYGERGSFTESDPLSPLDPYGVSKAEAEIALRQIASDTGMEVVIVRPPLVYGPGVKANFRTLIRLVARGIPLPLGAIDNRRSMVMLDNLVDFIVTCVEHPHAANETFCVSDGEDLSTTDLLRRVAHALGRPARLIPVPPAILWRGASLVGRRDVAQRLLDSLQLDISKAHRMLGWSPPMTVTEGLRRTVAGHRLDMHAADLSR